MEDFRVIHNQAEQDSVDVRESFDKLLMADKVVIRLKHDAIGGVDSFSNWIGVVDSINAVSDYEDMTSPYTVTTDYLFTSDKQGIDWSPPNVDSTKNTGAALDYTQTDVMVETGGGDAFQRGDTIVIESEHMKVKKVDGDVLTVERGFNGTTTALHVTNLDIYFFNEPDVEAIYYVSINWTKIFEQEELDKVDGSTTALTIGGFNPEEDIRGITAKVDSLANLTEVLDATETDVDVTDGTKFAIGDIIQIESEQMLVTDITLGTPDYLTVVRGYNDTTGATHSNELDVYIWKLTNEYSKYPKGGDKRVKKDLNKPTRFSEIEIHPVRNTANPFGELRLFNQTNKDDLRFYWNKFIHRSISPSIPASDTSYCKFILKESEDGTFDYMDDFEEANKWTYDRHYQSGVTHSGSQLNFGAYAVLIYEFDFPFLVKDFTITITVGSGTAYITYMTEEDYSTSYDGVGNKSSGVAFEVYERHFFIKISLNSGNITDVKFFTDTLRSAGCVLCLQIGSNTIAYGMPSNSRLDVIFRHQERSLRLEQEADTKILGGLARRLGQLEMHDHSYPYLSGGTARPVGKVVIPKLGYTGQAIQDAINSLPSSGGIVFIPEGTWTITSTITRIIDNVTIIGSGFRSTKLIGSLNAPIITIGGDNWSIEKLHIENGTALSSKLIYTNDKDYFIIKDCYFYKARHQIDISPNSIGGRIEKNFFKDPYQGSYEAYSILASGTQNHILNNHFIYATVPWGVYSIHIPGNENVVVGNTIQGCNIDDNGNNIGVYVDGDRNLIMGNIIRDHLNSNAGGAAYGIYVNTNADRTTILSNIIYNNENNFLNSGSNTFYQTATDNDPLNHIF